MVRFFQTGTSRMSRAGLTAVVLATLAGAALPALAQNEKPAATEPAAKEPAAKTTETAGDPTQDKLIMKNGQVLMGKIVSETADKVVMRIKIGTIESEVPYERSGIEKVVRATATTPAATSPAAAAGATAAASTAGVTGGRVTNNGYIAGDGTRYYYVELTGEFGTDITQTPIRQAMKNARDQKADIVIFMLDAKWEKFDVEAKFGEITRAGEIIPIITQELRSEWQTPPRVVFWVKKAMAGASFLPLASKELFMSSDAKIGGLGDLSYGWGEGDEVVRQKMISLFLGQAKGWALEGGHDPKLVIAMAQVEMVVSVRFVDGKPELFMGYPSNPGEELLTDDGQGPNRDSAEDIVNGTGNDALTLNERVAKMIGVSSGTVDTKDELLEALGLQRSGLDVSDRADRIMKDWKTGLERAKANLRKLVRDYGEVRVEAPGDYDARTKARSQRRRIIRDIRALLKQWNEALSREFMGRNEIPGDQQWEYWDKGIEVEQLRDRKE